MKRARKVVSSFAQNAPRHTHFTKPAWKQLDDIDLLPLQKRFLEFTLSQIDAEFKVFESCAKDSAVICEADEDEDGACGLTWVSDNFYFYVSIGEADSNSHWTLVIKDGDAKIRSKSKGLSEKGIRGVLGMIYEHIRP